VVPGEHPGRISRDHCLAGVLAVALALFYLLAQSWTQELLVESTDVLFIAVSGACSLLGLLVVRKRGSRGKFGVVHLGFFHCAIKHGDGRELGLRAVMVLIALATVYSPCSSGSAA
jgi:hypothetical protein